MYSAPITSSSRLISSSSTSYESINPQPSTKNTNNTSEGIIEVITTNPIDERFHSRLDPRLGEQRWEIKTGETQSGEELWRSITIEDFRGIKTRLFKNQADSLRCLANNFEQQSSFVKMGSTVLNLGALITLVTMKLQGHIDVPPSYFVGLITEEAFSYLLLYGISDRLNQDANRIKREAETFSVLATNDHDFPNIEEIEIIRPLGVLNSSLESIQSTLRHLVEELQESSLNTKFSNVVLNFTTLTALTIMASAGYFSEHPAYIWILFASTLLSSIVWIDLGSKFSEYADSTKKIADAFPKLRKV